MLNEVEKELELSGFLLNMDCLRYGESLRGVESLAIYIFNMETVYEVRLLRAGTVTRGGLLTYTSKKFSRTLR